MKYLYWVFATLSMFVNALFAGRPYETVCARAWRKRHSPNVLTRRWARATIILTEIFDKDHCRKAHDGHVCIIAALKQVKGEAK